VVVDVVAAPGNERLGNVGAFAGVFKRFDVDLILKTKLN